MSDDGQVAYMPTPSGDLEHQICSACVPKNEREWWAHYEIEKLRDRLAVETLALVETLARAERAEQEAAALRAELAEARRDVEALRADAWQPIETAPKDGALILLRSPKGRIADGFWGHYGVWARPYVMVEPTEWRPLPISAARAGGGK